MDISLTTAAQDRDDGVSAPGGPQIASFPTNAQPPVDRVPLPSPDDDVRPRQGMPATAARYLQGDTLPVTSSVLTSNSKYLNNPIYRDAYATQSLRRHGHDLPTTYMVPIMVRAFQETTDYARVEELIAAEKIRIPAFGAWLDARDDFSFRRDDLATCAPGTLGQALHEFLNIPGMDMEFSSRENAGVSDMEYLNKRRGYFHDLEHIVTGFNPNTAGEAALSIMNVTQDARFFTPELAQIMSQASMWVSSTGIYRTSLHYHHALPTYLDAIHQGIAAGLAVNQPMFMVRWIDYTDWQLEDIAKHLGFVRGPGAAWDWTTESTNG